VMSCGYSQEEIPHYQNTKEVRTPAKAKPTVRTLAYMKRYTVSYHSLVTRSLWFWMMAFWT